MNSDTLYWICMALYFGVVAWAMGWCAMTEAYEDEALAAPTGHAEQTDCCIECGMEIDSQRQIDRPGTDLCRGCEIEYSA